MVFSVSAASAVFAAQDAEVIDDKVGNQFGAGYNVDLGGDVLDVCGAGYNVKLKDTTAEGSAALAGYSVDVDDTVVGGSFFAAGCNVDFDNCNVENNIIATGNSISIDAASSAKSMRLAGASVTYDGTADYICIDADHVEINGIVNGDAEIEAASVSFGDNAKITGNLKLSAKEEPSVSGKVDGEYSFTELKTQEEIAAENEVAVKSNTSIGKKIAGVVGGRIYWIVAMFIAAAALILLCGKHIDASGEAVIAQPGKIIGIGFMALIGVPVASLILAITIIGLPSAAILLTLYIITLSLSQTFAGLALGRILLGEKLGKPVVASLIGVAVLVVVDAIPWVGGLTSLAAGIFTLGYIFTKLSDRGFTKAETVGTMVNEEVSVPADEVKEEL